MYKHPLSLMFYLICTQAVHAMDYPPAPFIDITTINPYEIEEFDGILDDNVILQEAKNEAISGGTSALTSSLIGNGVMFIASQVGKGDVHIHQIPLEVASATLQGAANGWQVGFHKGVANEIASMVSDERKELVKALLKDGMEGVKTGIDIACQSNGNVLKGLAIGGVCGAASGATKVATRAVITQKIGKEGPVASAISEAGETSIDYARDVVIKTSMASTKDVSCVIS